jgi:preprotein translocase subunit SecY
LATNSQLGKSAASGFPWGRLWFLLGALVVYRIGAHIPVPGIDPVQLAALFKQNEGGILGMFNMFSGGALSRFTVFALGIMPYISASIIMQLASIVSPQLEALKKEGEAGRRKITQYTRYFTVVLALFQAFGIAVALEAQQGLVLDPGIGFRFVTVVTLLTGTMFLMWLGEQITERGLGNGISIIIFAGIAAGLPGALSGLFTLVSNGSIGSFSAIVIVILVALVTYAVVFVERGQRKILVNYAKRQVGNKIYGGQTSHLPLKLNMAGVIPPIFASSIILFPATIVDWFTRGKDVNNPFIGFLKDLAASLSPGEPIHALLYAVAIVFFCFFYTALVFNSKNGGQLEEERRVCTGHPSGRADRTLHRQDPDAPDPGRCGLYHAGVPGAGVPAEPVESTFPIRRNLAPDHRGRHDGFHGAGAELRHVAAIRVAAAQGKFQGRYPVALSGRRPQE